APQRRASTTARSTADLRRRPCSSIQLPAPGGSASSTPSTTTRSATNGTRARAATAAMPADSMSTATAFVASAAARFDAGDSSGSATVRRSPRWTPSSAASRASRECHTGSTGSGASPSARTRRGAMTEPGATPSPKPPASPHETSNCAPASIARLAAAAARAAPGPLWTTSQRSARGDCRRKLVHSSASAATNPIVKAPSCRTGSSNDIDSPGPARQLAARRGRERVRRERKPVGRAREHEAQRTIAHQREIRGQHGRLDRAARHFDLAAGAERRVAMDLAQREHGEADRPQAKAADSRLALRNQARVLERIAQMRVTDADQLVQAVAERGLRVPRLEPFEIHRAARENGARQPARARLTVVPDVLQDVRHLQTLTERYGQAQHDFAFRGDFGAMQSEQLGAHLADDAGNVVAILVEVAKPSQALVALELRHAAAHDRDAARQRLALLGGAAMRHANDSRGVAH